MDKCCLYAEVSKESRALQQELVYIHAQRLVNGVHQVGDERMETSALAFLGR